MKVAQWAEIRRLSEIEGLSQRATARRLRCSHRTVKKALALTQPPDENRRAARGSILDPFKSKIDALLAKYPDLSAVRLLEEIAKEPAGYEGQISLVRQYLRQVRPVHGRIYQEVSYEPGQAMQVDWGSCGQVRIAHPRCYDRGRVLCQDDHRLAALKLRNRVRARDLEDHFDALGPEARQFHLELRRRPVKTAVHLRRILNLVRLYGRDDVRAALVLANQYGTYDAAYVETLVLQERRRRELPSPTPLCPKRRELIDEIQLDDPDPAAYDRLCQELPNSAEVSAPEELPPTGDLPSQPF